MMDAVRFTPEGRRTAMRLAIVLLPDAEGSAACTRYARELVAGHRPRVVLGPEALPHVTLVHVETDEDPAIAWEETRRALPASLDLAFLALGLLRYDTPYNAPPADPATMAWLIVPCTSALRDAERAALGLAWVRRGAVTTSNEDAFQPHLTLAIWEGDGTAGTGAGACALPRDVLGRVGVRAQLALGVIGANGAFQETLFASEG